MNAKEIWSLLSSRPTVAIVSFGLLLATVVIADSLVLADPPHGQRPPACDNPRAQGVGLRRICGAATASPTPPVTASPSPTASPTPTPSASPSPSPSAAPTGTQPPTASPGPTASPTPSAAPTDTQPPSASPTPIDADADLDPFTLAKPERVAAHSAADADATTNNRKPHGVALSQPVASDRLAYSGYSDSDADATADNREPDSDSYAYTHTHPNAEPVGIGEPDAHAYSHTNPNAVSYANGESDPNADPDSEPVADAEPVAQPEPVPNSPGDPALPCGNRLRRHRP